MHFAAEWIETTQVADPVGKQSYGVFSDLEKPGLGIVRVGCQDRGAQGPIAAIISMSPPFLPGRISHAFAA
jgi:hypothetical protein